MEKYTPNLQGRDVVIISDYVEGYSKEDTAYENELLSKIYAQAAEHNVKVHFVEDTTIEGLANKLKAFDKDKIVIFNWFEEVNFQPNTEDLVTDFLQQNNYVFSGGRSDCLRLTRNKVDTKIRLQQENVPTPGFQIVHDVVDVLPNLKLPFFIKLADEHGSKGIADSSIVNSLEELNAEILRYRGLGFKNIMIEEYIDGREFTVSLIGNTKPLVLPIMELDYTKLPQDKPKILNYDSKWNITSIEYLNSDAYIVIDLPKDLRETIEHVSREAYKAMGCRCWGRLEMREKDGIPYVIDVNSNPNFELHTSFCEAALEYGFNYGELVLRICQYALEEN